MGFIYLSNNQGLFTFNIKFHQHLLWRIISQGEEKMNRNALIALGACFTLCSINYCMLCMYLVFL